jgi:hypothetical protein
MLPQAGMLLLLLLRLRCSCLQDALEHVTGPAIFLLLLLLLGLLTSCQTS